MADSRIGTDRLVLPPGRHLLQLGLHTIAEPPLPDASYRRTRRLVLPHRAVGLLDGSLSVEI